MTALTPPMIPAAALVDPNGLLIIAVVPIDLTSLPAGPTTTSPTWPGARFDVVKFGPAPSTVSTLLIARPEYAGSISCSTMSIPALPAAHTTRLCRTAARFRASASACAPEGSGLPFKDHTLAMTIVLAPWELA